MQFFVTERIGEKRSRTPEGFLVCHDVPLARVGEQLYTSQELEGVIRPKAGTNYIRVMRDAEQVFHADTVSSAEGKPFVVFHPDGLVVTPKNFRELNAGHIQNVRRGEGSLADLMLGDLMVCAEDAIEAIESNEIREISLGYDCEYDELGYPHELPSGIARQRGIIINHAALVPEGRCGPRCSIGDHSECNGNDVQPETLTMAKTATTDKRSAWDRVRAAFTSNDAKAFDEAFAVATTAPDGEGGDTVVIHNHLAAPAGGDRRAVADAATLTADSDAPAWFTGFVAVLDKRLKAIDAKIKDADDDDDDEEEKERKRKEKEKNGDRRARDAKSKDDDDDEEEKERKRKEKEKETGDQALLAELELELPDGLTMAKVGTKDSVAFEDTFQRLIAGAEILTPGIRVPTFDSQANAKATFDAMCGLRRKSLGLALNTPATAGMIEQVTNGRMIAIDKAPCSYVRTVFDAVVAMQKAANNGAAGGGTATVDRGGVKTASPIRTIADLNAFIAQRNKGEKATA